MGGCGHNCWAQASARLANANFPRVWIASADASEASGERTTWSTLLSARLTVSVSVEGKVVPSRALPIHAERKSDEGATFVIRAFDRAGCRLAVESLRQQRTNVGLRRGRHPDMHGAREVPQEEVAPTAQSAVSGCRADHRRGSRSGHDSRLFTWLSFQRRRGNSASLRAACVYTESRFLGTPRRSE
jgi:hypothetical protein